MIGLNTAQRSDLQGVQVPEQDVGCLICVCGVCARGQSKAQGILNDHKHFALRMKGSLDEPETHLRSYAEWPESFGALSVTGMQNHASHIYGRCGFEFSSMYYVLLHTKLAL